MVIEEPLFCYEITAEVTAFDRFFEDQSDPPSLVKTVRRETVVLYVAPSEELALAYFHATWKGRTPEVKSVHARKVDAVIRLTRHG